MKKNYLLFAALFVSTILSAQDAFWSVTNYKGAFPITDNTPATDWTSGWSNFDPENTVYPATTSTVSTDITANTTWSGVVLLQNKVYVKNNATLTIAPGTIIRGDKLTQATLIITRGAKLIANATASSPIVFTSNEAVGSRNEGDWGGIVLLGLAKNNQPGGVANIEGIVPTTDTQFGGNFDTDNSGIIKYVRIEFAGIALEPNKEVNGITFGSVGSGTLVDNVQVSFSGDDSFEWFGGTVNCKHLIAYRGLDDDFDTDFGYRGKVQFFLSIRDKDLFDAPGDSNSFESDNDAAGSTAQPKTAPIFSNGTIVGPKGNGTIALPTGEKFEKSFRLRRNTATSVFNTLTTGWEKGLSIEGTPVVNNVNGDTLVFAYNNTVNYANNTNTIYNAGTPTTAAASTAAFYNSFWGADGNDSTQTLAQVNWVNLFTALGTTPDARLAAGSVAGSGANFMNAKFYSVAVPTTSTASYTYCAGATASALTANASLGNSLRWYTQATGGAFTTTAPTPSTTAVGSFTYYVSQANVNNDESQRIAITVTITAPNVTPLFTQVTSICSGASLSALPTSSSNNVTGVWSPILNNTQTTLYTFTPNAGQCATQSTMTITVNANPSAIVNNTGNLTFCQGGSVILSSSSASGNVWSNGATNQSIVVNTSGNYTVTVTNSNGCSTTSQVTVTTVIQNVTPYFSQVAPICEGASLNSLPGNSLNNITGVWSPLPNNTQTTTYTFTPDLGQQCATQANLTITVNPNPNAVINYSSALNFCQGGNIVLTSSSLTGNLWSNGATSQSITVNNSGIYTVSVTNSNGCIGNSQPITVNVSSAPTPTVTASSFQACTGQTITLTSTSGDSYVWSNGATTQSITVNAGGSYDVTTTNSDACNGVGTSSPVILTFNTVSPTVSASATQACLGEVITLTSTLADSYTWSNGATTQSIDVTSSGSYDVTTTNSNTCNGIGTSSPVTVSFNAVYPTVTSSATQACSGEAVTLTASSADSYLWSNNETTQTIQVSTSGNYSVVTTNSNACLGVGSSNSIAVDFTPTPTADGTMTLAGNIATFTNTSTGATSYSWDFGDFTNSSATAPTHAYAVNGTYTVVLTAINGNCTDTTVFIVDVTVGLNELASSSNLTIFPNPASETVNVSFQQNTNDLIQIELIDATGRVIAQESSLEIGTNNVSFEVTNLSSGFYTVRLTNSNGSENQKLMIQK